MQALWNQNQNELESVGMKKEKLPNLKLTNYTTTIQLNVYDKEYLKEIIQNQWNLDTTCDMISEQERKEYLFILRRFWWQLHDCYLGTELRLNQQLRECPKCGEERRNMKNHLRHCYGKKAKPDKETLKRIEMGI